jgi:hypothetical protein
MPQYTEIGRMANFRLKASFGLSGMPDLLPLNRAGIGFNLLAFLQPFVIRHNPDNCFSINLQRHTAFPGLFP